MAVYLLREKVVSIALSQVGYKEYNNNQTKYAKDLDKVNFYNYPKYPAHAEWCDIFVDWCVYEASGKNKARALAALYEPTKDNCGAGCKYSAQYFRSKGAWSSTAVLGSQIFFGKKGAETHTGIVVAIGASTITTVEGNKGNMVKKCSYKKTDSKIVGYGLIKYDSQPQPQPQPTPQPQPEPTPTPQPKPQPDYKTYKVKTNTGVDLRIRKAPSVKSKQIGSIPNGKTCKVYSISKGWANVEYNKIKGYSSAKYLKEVK